MKYHFIYPDVDTGYLPGAHHGLAHLFAVLKSNGHGVSLHHIRHRAGKKNIWRILDIEKPDVVGFTCMSNQMQFVELWSQWVKEWKDVPVVCGGVHTTLCTEEVLDNPHVDMVCVGEGERAVLDSRFWKKQGSVTVKPASHPLVEDLDTLPFPDYSLFDCEKILKMRCGDFAVMCSRGCPYDCAYCCNHALREVQKGLGKYFRYRSVENTVRMLEDVAGRYPVRSFSFADDIFGIDVKWVREFCVAYPRRLGMPFSCNMRVESATVETLEMLRSAGCTRVEMGIESGSAWLRSRMLNRRMTNEQIVDAFEAAHRLGLKTRAYNMVGMPCETAAMIRGTINMNKRVRPDQVAVFYFYPFKGSRLYELCREKRMLGKTKATGYTEKSVLQSDTISPKDLRRLHDEFQRYAISRRVDQLPSPLARITVGAALELLRLATAGKEVSLVGKLYSCIAKLRSVL